MECGDHVQMYRRAAQYDGLDSDMSLCLNHLDHHGPATYGLAAAALGWGATRAWQAEARLRASGLVTLDRRGRAEVRNERDPK